MTTYPKSPKEMTRGMIYFPRMLDKIRLHARGELHEDYHKNLGAMRAADGACCNFLRIDYADLRDRKSTRLNSSHSQISYAVFCLKKKNYRTYSYMTQPD